MQSLTHLHLDELLRCAKSFKSPEENKYFYNSTTMQTERQ